MKIIKAWLAVLALLAVCSSCVPSGAPHNSDTLQESFSETEEVIKSETKGDEQTVVPSYSVLNYDDMKAMWLSQYDLNKIYTDGTIQRPRDDFSARIDGILDNVVSLGINTVIVQVRPFADSMYPSEYYPMSAYAVGTYGKNAEFDPFEIIVEKAHERELSVHAWINPLRAMTDNEIKGWEKCVICHVRR